MSAIYEPKGAAREYAELACNLYTGCNHGCLYCYAPGCRRLSREQFTSDVRPYADILKRLEKDADKMAAAGDTRRVLFSFTSDPYQHLRYDLDITRRALQIMVDRGLQFEVCTKGGLAAARDFDLLSQGGRLGTSLVWNTGPAEEWEPRAASVGDRLSAMVEAHEAAGIYNWVSVEPVIDPQEAIEAIHMATLCWADEFRVGKINHDAKLSAAVDWQAFVDELYPLLLETGKRFIIKQSLHPYLQGRPATGGPA